MKRSVSTLTEIILVAATLTLASYAGQFAIAQDCGEHGQFRFGDMVYTCSVKGWAR